MSPPPSAPPPSATPNSSSSTTTASSSNPNMFNYLWISFLISLPTSSSTEEAVSLVLPSEARDAFAGVLRCPAANPNLNYRPIIGILSQPGDGASYLKFVESAGARVMSHICNEPFDALYKKLKLVNGVIFTGVWAKTGLYVDAVESISSMLSGRMMLETIFLCSPSA